MALEDIQEQYIPKENSFYREHYHQIIFGIMIFLAAIIAINIYLLYQLSHRPLPVFSAVDPKNQTMPLTPYDAPDIQPDVILRFAAQAATVSYTFRAGFYKEQLQAARQYFTDDGWNGYLSSVSGLINDVVAKNLIINGAVSGPPVINNQGELGLITNPADPNHNPGNLNARDYAWRVAVPFAVTYQSSNTVYRNFMVVLTIVKVPTSSNANGIGIDQFDMYPVTGAM